MNVLVTGAHGFMGRNLVAYLEAVRDGKAPSLAGARLGGRNDDSSLNIFEHDLDTPPGLLDGYCRDADFVMHLAGVNRPESEGEFMEGNFGFTSALLDALRKHGNACPVMIASSTQAALDNPYGRSKKAGEDLLLAYAVETGARALVYRFPNVFGKWCRPNYNSTVATFCHNVANGLPIVVRDRSHPMTLVYIDDIVAEMVRARQSGRLREHKNEERRQL